MSGVAPAAYVRRRAPGTPTTGAALRAAACATALACIAVVAPRASDGTTIRLGAGGNLQAALDAARPGDTILLARDAEFVGNFILPVKEGQAWITIRSDVSADAVAPAGHRIGPEHAPQLAAIRSPNSKAAIRAAAAAHHWRLELLEFPPAASPAATLVELGDGGAAQRTLDSVPHDFVIDRCYLYGDPAKGQKRGLGLHSGRTTITGAYFADFKLPGQDTQAIAGWNGTGPYHVENNYIEGAGENFLLGGSDPSIPDLVPSDLTFRRNHVAHPASWKDENWAVKNLFELKSARRALVEGNLFERNWVDAQPGYAILFTPRTTTRAPWVVVEDVTFRYNVIRDVAGGVNVLGRDKVPSGVTRRLRIAHNLFYRVDHHVWGGAGHFLLAGEGAEDLIVEHNTVVQTGNVISAWGLPMRGFVFRDNIAYHNRYGVHGADAATGRDSIDTFFPRAIFSNNVLAGGRAALYPSGNFFPSERELEEAFVDFHGGDLRIRPGSPFATAASDGGTLGADLDAIRRAVGADWREQDAARAPRGIP